MFLLLGVLLMAAVEPAGAQDNSLDRIVELYRGNARHWEATLAGFALTLFWILATIEFTWAAIQLAFRGADLGEWLSTLVNQVLFIGFFASLLQFSAEWARAIVDSFRQAASAAAQANGASGGIAPSDIFDTGMQIAIRFTESASLWSPIASVGLFIGMLVVIICFALIAAFMVLTLVESYIVISAGVLFMGFGGSRWTKDFATRILVYTVSVGAKLFVLQLLVSLGAQIFRDLSTGVANDQAGLLTIIGAAIVMLAVTKSVPEMVQGLINGSSHGQSGAVWTAATAAATGVAGGVLAARSAALLAQEQLKAEQGAAASPASLPWRTAANLTSHGVGNIGDRLSGRAIHGTRGGQMANAMDQDRWRMAQARMRQEETGGTISRAAETHPGKKRGQPPTPPAVTNDNDPTKERP